MRLSRPKAPCVTSYLGCALLYGTIAIQLGCSSKTPDDVWKLQKGTHTGSTVANSPSSEHRTLEIGTLPPPDKLDPLTLSSIKALNDSLNDTEKYALTQSDIELLNTNGVLEKYERVALAPLIKN